MSDVRKRPETLPFSGRWQTSRLTMEIADMTTHTESPEMVSPVNRTARLIWVAAGSAGVSLTRVEVNAIASRMEPPTEAVQSKILVAIVKALEDTGDAGYNGMAVSSLASAYRTLHQLDEPLPDWDASD